MAKKGKKGTPGDLDFAFKRHLIDEEDYKEFWPRWWEAGKTEREEIIEELLAEAGKEILPGIPLKGNLTKSKREAKKQAKAIGGFVVRRNKRGQFSKRGSLYQAIRRKGK